MKKTIVATLVCVAFLFIGGNFAFAGSEPEPFKLITAPEVKDLLEEGKVVVVHVLSEIEYGIQHIPASINIPIIKMKTTNKLPKDKDTPLIFYCMGKR